MVHVALLVPLETKSGREENGESFLRGGLSLVNQEPTMIAWFAIRLGPSTLAIFGSFPDKFGQQVHLAGQVAATLMARVSVVASRLP